MQPTADMAALPRQSRDYTAIRLEGHFHMVNDAAFVARSGRDPGSWISRNGPALLVWTDNHYPASGVQTVYAIAHLTKMSSPSNDDTA